jgi:hypothetical protein
VGLFAADCGAECANDSNNQQYYACNGTSCTGVAVPDAQQVTNPVSALPVDNNGVIVELPEIPLGGVTSTSGYVVMGIGTETNNIPGAVTTFTADPNVGEFYTQFDGPNYDAFLDTGSNGYFFPVTAQAPDCGTGWYCPTTTQQFIASIINVSGNVGGNVNFYIGNATNLFNTSNSVFVELGGEAGSDQNGPTFDWGLPFFMGRNVYVGIEGYSSSLGSGPYWSF